jgi:hypothetical protein
LNALKEEFACKFKVVESEKSEELKAKQAAPGKPAIYVE